MSGTPEQRARRQIDAMLVAAGWAVQDKVAMNLAAADGVAVREFQTRAGPADYLLFLGNQLVGVVEAKKAGVTLASVEAQTRAYADSALRELQVPVRPLPFLYESTGVETWFTNGLDPDPRARSVFSFHRPDTLRGWLDAELDRRAGKPGVVAAPTLQGRMRLAPALNTTGMWPAQIRAVQNLEQSIREGRPRALIQMATGSGKTFTAISALYRLIKEGGARRVLFLVDRGNLGRQALKEFQSYTTPDDGRKFTELYNVVNLAHNTVDPVNKVVITTIQRLYSILKGEDELPEELEEGSAFTGGGAALVREPPPVAYTPWLPPDFFDVVVIDECHRSIYSLWRQVLEYFDASLIGLTATPDKRTYGFFQKNVVSEYTHTHAVRDRVNVPFSVYEIRTRVTEQGAMVVAEPDTVLGKRDRQTRAVRWEQLDQDFTYTASQLDRSVVVPDQIRTVLRTFKDKLFTEIFPGRSEIPKTLIFAKSDDHAEDILRILRQDWPLSNEQAVKVTYKPERAASSSSGGGAARRSASRKPEALIAAFRNSYNPRIAVTVDMIATGTDIKPLECVVFLRSVKSRGLFEQMKGRGVRVIPDADFRAVTPDATTKTHFVIVDCVGVMEENKGDPPLDRERGISFEKLLVLVAAGNRDEDVLCTQAAQQALREEAASPIAHNPELRQALLDVRKAQEITIDVATLDEVNRAGARKDLEPDHDADQALVSEFEAFCQEHRDELDALTVLYSRPYAQRLTRKQLLDLVAAILRPPRQWTGEALWAAYERVEAGRVRGASKGRLMTDLISLARHAMGVDEELVSYADQAAARFESWLAQQANRGRTFTDEQRAWLELIRDRIAVDLEVRVEDLDQVPFVEKGGLGRFYELFGEEYEAVVDELNRELVA